MNTYDYGEPIWTDRLISTFADGEILMNKDKHFKIKVYQKTPSKNFMYYHQKESEEHLFGTIVPCGDKLKISIRRDVFTNEKTHDLADLIVDETFVQNTISLIGWDNDERFWFKYAFSLSKDTEITMFADDVTEFISICKEIK